MLISDSHINWQEFENPFLARLLGVFLSAAVTVACVVPSGHRRFIIPRKHVRTRTSVSPSLPCACRSRRKLLSVKKMASERDEEFQESLEEYFIVSTLLSLPCTPVSWTCAHACIVCTSMSF